MAKRQKLTHNDALGKLGTSTRACVDRIVETFNRATPSDIESGARWYGDAGAVALQLVALGVPTIEHAAGVISSLSPRTSWSRNVAGAVALVTTGTAPGCIAGNVSKARRVLESDAPLSLFDADKAPKTARFAANILGDCEVVTVDVWAARVAFGDRVEDPELALRRVGVYGAVEHAYRLAARRLGVDPVTAQATVWIVARNGRAA